ASTSHTVQVRSTDSGGLSVEQTFTIAVTNVLDGPAPDLQIANLRVDDPNNLRSGEPVTVRWEVTNAGNLPTTGAFFDRLVVRNQSTGETLATVTLIYDPAVSGNIPAGQNSSRSF